MACTLKYVKQIWIEFVRLNYGNSAALSNLRWLSSSSQPPTAGKCGVGATTKEIKKGKTPVGQLDDAWETAANKMEPQKTDEQDPAAKDPYAPFPDARNPITGEIGGPRGPEPTRYGDWERKGRLSDF
jgi:hypothetical protein